MPSQLSNNQVGLFDTLLKFYLRSRYPDYTSSLTSLITEKYAKSMNKEKGVGSRGRSGA
jgi:HEPN domain-containing protein